MDSRRGWRRERIASPESMLAARHPQRLPSNGHGREVRAGAHGDAGRVRDLDGIAAAGWKRERETEAGIVDAARWIAVGDLRLAARIPGAVDGEPPARLERVADVRLNGCHRILRALETRRIEIVVRREQ